METKLGIEQAPKQPCYSQLPHYCRLAAQRPTSSSSPLTALHPPLLLHQHHCQPSGSLALHSLLYPTSPILWSALNWLVINLPLSLAIGTTGTFSPTHPQVRIHPTYLSRYLQIRAHPMCPTSSNPFFTLTPRSDPRPPYPNNLLAYHLTTCTRDTQPQPG
ncbi:hypothetical protein LX36DRAFT_354031 [Colletotrichum falcatum]|nr:hypothetical protein LX36DRAFT_354031 [Colletotrichum falcatum]